MQDARCRLCKDVLRECSTERHNQVADMVYRDISAKYMPEVQWSMINDQVENDQAKVLWYRLTKLVISNQLDMQ